MLIDATGKIVVLVRGGFDGLMRYNSDGTLDTTFGVGGKVTLGNDDQEIAASAVALQADGRLVVAGDTYTEFVVARLRNDGSLDASFGSHGTATVDFVTGPVDAHSVAIDADGKIVVLGSARDQSYDADFALARFNSNSTLDTSFGVGGKIRTDLGSKEDEGYGVLIEPSGKIVVGGSSLQATGSEFALARYANNGVLDPTFDGDGKVTTTFGSETSSRLAGIARDPSGKIVAVGSTARYQGGSFTGPFDFALARYNTDGSLDSSFDADGRVTTSFAPGSDDVAASVAMDSSGKILVAGSSYHSSGGWDFALARYNPNGTLDASFSGDGTVTTDFGGTCDHGEGLALDPSGKIVVVGGSLAAATRWDVALARYGSDGTLDPTFDSDGLVATNLLTFGTYDYAGLLAIQGDGKIIVGGRLGDGSSHGLTLVRYHSDGTLDSGFGSGGKVVSSSSFEPWDAVIQADGKVVSSSSFEPWDAVIQADGKIVVVGSSCDRNADCDFAVSRYHADGNLDKAFGNAGVVTVDFGSESDDVTSVALAADGKIVVAGSLTRDFTDDFAVARLNPNGTLDTTLDGDGKVVTDFGENRADRAAS